jgi:hypothetical protein
MGWQGRFAPAGTSAAVVARMNAAVRVTVAFHVTGTSLIVLRVLYCGRDLEDLLQEGNDG